MTEKTDATPTPHGTWKVTGEGKVEYVPAKGEDGSVSIPTALTFTTTPETPVTTNILDNATLTRAGDTWDESSVRIDGQAEKHDSAGSFSLEGPFLTFTPSKNSDGATATITLRSHGGQSVELPVVMTVDKNATTVDVTTNDTSGTTAQWEPYNRDATHTALHWGEIGGGTLVAVLVASSVWKWTRSRRPRIDATPYVARWASASARLHDLSDEWLSYDRDIEKFLSAPAMRDFRLAEVESAARSLADAEHVESTGLSTKTDAAEMERVVSAFEKAVERCDTALSMAIFAAEQMARNGLDERERNLLERARDALAIALDGATPEPERRSALRAVEAALRSYGVEMPVEAKRSAVAAIESRRPVAAIPAAVRVPPLARSGLGVLTRDVVLASIPGLDDPIARATAIRTRVRRLGESEANALAAAIGASMGDVATLGRTSATPAVLHGDVSRVRDLTDAVAAARAVVADLANPASVEPDVAIAARDRLVELDELVTLGRQVGAVPMAARV